jgi:hypothetical protein
MILVGILIIVGVYFTRDDAPVPKNPEIVKPFTMQPIVESDPLSGYVMNFSISGNILTVSKGSAIIDELTISTEAAKALVDIPVKAEKFLIDHDVNFDGYIDVGIFASTGYAGVNNYYDFYIYNPDTGSFEKNLTLVGISNPQIDIAKRTIISSYRSGPQWYKKSYVLEGKTYIVGPEIKQ